MKTKKETCEACNDTGILNISQCCGAAPKSNGDGSTDDYGICPDCGDHCIYGVKCEECEAEAKQFKTKEMKKEDRKYWPTHEFIQRLITQTGFNPGKMINPYEVEIRKLFLS